MNSNSTNSIKKRVTFNRLNLLVIFCMFFVIDSSVAQIQIGQDIFGESIYNQSGDAVSTSEDGKRIIIGAPYNNTSTGLTRVYEDVLGTWVQIGQDINGETTGNISGSSVSISADGSRIAIGAPTNGGNGFKAGHVRIYEEILGTWIQIGQDIDGEAAGDELGTAVSLSADGTRVVTGAIFNDDAGTDAGQVRVYQEINGNWVQIGQDLDGEAAGDHMGMGVSISADGSRIACGAPQNDGNGFASGHARVFEDVNGTWVQIGQDVDGESQQDRIGWSISISSDGSTFVIGSTAHNNGNGHIRVYKETNGIWSQIGQDINGKPGNGLGWSVSISSDGTRVASTAGNSSGQWRTKIYEEQNSIWVKIGFDIIGEGERDGWSVAISGDGKSIAIGYPFYDGINGPNTLTRQGRTRVYSVNNTLFNNRLAGNVIHDLDLNCSEDTLEPGLQNWFVQAKRYGGGVLYGITDSAGNYEIYADSGKFDVIITPPNYLWQACHALFTVNVSSNDTVVSNFMLNGTPCPYLTINVSTPFLRRCITNNYVVSYCNQGTTAASNAYVEVEFPSQMLIDSSSIPWNSQVGNVFSFPLGTINQSACGSFRIYATPTCDSTILGQTMCVKAHIFPDSICTPSDTTWEGSITTVDVNCQPDSLTFTIKNTGIGDMQTPQEYFVIQDDLIMKQGFFQLNSMDSSLVKVPSNGSTYRLYAGQSPGHFPYNYHPTIAIEGCGVNGSGNFSLGFITMFSENDVSEQISIDCQEIMGPYDPNDKRAQPKGYGQQHYIEVGDDLDYHIRFQNVGTDTAFLVVIRDTISTHLNIASIRQGTSSHPYQLDVVDGNVLRFTFNDILLVDSTTNEPGSHGFVTFKISQVDSLPLGTMIYNSAGIYFDFNEPVITNQTYHEIGADFIPIIATSNAPAPDYPTVSLSVHPNPFTEYADFILEGAPFGDKSFELYDAMGRLVHKEQFSEDSSYRLYKNNLSTGMYFYKILNNNKLLISGKLVAGY